MNSPHAYTHAEDTEIDLCYIQLYITQYTRPCRQSTQAEHIYTHTLTHTVVILLCIVLLDVAALSQCVPDIKVNVSAVPVCLLHVCALRCFHVLYGCVRVCVLRCGDKAVLCLRNNTIRKPVFLLKPQLFFSGP